MHTKPFSLWALVLLVPTAGLPAGNDGSQSVRWSWQETYAEVDPKGDLRWKPHSFVFERGTSVRYIDFAAGDDESSGDTPERAWKRHPWDPLATGQAAAESGVHTYNFKRGVVYRGRLLVKDPGRSGEPVRLTSDPAWGSGEAVLCGSERVARWTRGADHPDIPEPEKVWWADLDFAPRSVWRVGSDGQISRIPLARTPNWKVSNPDDVKSEWWVWDVPGVLEDWIAGALKFNPAKRHYAVLTHADMMQPFSFRDLKKSQHEGARPEPHTVEGEALKNPQVYRSNFLIEVQFKTMPGHTGGVLMEKLKDRGYSLMIGAAGRLAFRVQGPDTAGSVESRSQVNDGHWHHAIVEADRETRTLTLYLNGRKDAVARGVDASVSLANDGDVHVGGTPDGRYLDGTLDFLRLAHGTLADADTTIEELYAWQFDGPFLRDFTGRSPIQGRRTVGAIEAK